MKIKVTIKLTPILSKRIRLSEPVNIAASYGITKLPLGSAGT